MMGNLDVEGPERDNSMTRKSRKTSVSMLDRIPLRLTHPPKRVCFCIPIEWIVLPPEGEEVAIRNSSLTTVFLLLNTMIGSGIIVQAYVFSQSGIVSTIIEYVVIGTMMFYGVEMMIKVAVRRDIFDFSAVADNILGVYGRLAVDLSIVVNNAGALLSYILIIGTLFEDIVTTFSDCSAGYCNIAFLTILPICCFTIPLCLIRNFGHLAVISYISVAVIMSIIFLVIIGGPIRREYYPTDDDSAIMAGNFLGSIRNIGDVIFALGFVTAIFHAYHAMENKSTVAFTEVARTTTILGVAMCFFTGLAGYLSFRGATNTNILLNFPGAVGAVFKLALITHLILYIPGDFVIMRTALWKLFSVDVSKQSDALFIITTLASIITITFIAIMIQLFAANSNALGIVVDITGGIAGSVVYFVIPGLCGMKIYKDSQEDGERLLYRKGQALFGFGVVVMILVFIANEI